MPATKEDATLVVQLSSWASTAGIDDAIGRLFDDGFDAETASARDDDVRKALNFGETIGTLTKHGLLDQALVLDLWWVSGIWGRVAPAAERARQEVGQPALYENFEALAQAQS